MNRQAAGALKLNAMQRMMLDWSELHPYNACHIYEIAGRGDLGRLQAAARETFLANRLGAVEVSGDGKRYRVEPFDAPEMQRIVEDVDVESRVTSHVAGELNRPFARPRCCPMRFAMLSSDSTTHYLVTTYDHWTADSASSRMVLRRILRRYLGLEIPQDERPLSVFPGSYRDAFKGRLHLLDMAASALSNVRSALFEAPAAQPAYVSAADMRNDYQFRRAASGTVSRIRQYARSLGATVHDVILAALGRAMASHLPRRTCRGRGRDVTLGTIVDTRRDAVENMDDVLGTFLAHYVVRLPPNGVGSLEAAVRFVTSLTAGIKARRSYLNSLAGVKLAGVLWPHVKKSSRPHFMRKAFPLTAGVSNVVLREDWLGEGSGVLGYWRAASTGPTVPLVLSPTSFGDEMNVGVSYRVTGFSAAKVAGILDMFLEQIENPRGFGIFSRPIERRVAGAVA